MDIDDILREVDPVADAVPRETRDLQALTRAWVAERSAPELLRWPADGLFERINDCIKTQIEKVEEMTGDMDPKTNFALIVIQTELERYRYLVRSYLRARIAKVRASHLPTRESKDGTHGVIAADTSFDNNTRSTNTPSITCPQTLYDHVSPSSN
jgi:GINS complex subunit 4